MSTERNKVIKELFSLATREENNPETKRRACVDFLRSVPAKEHKPAPTTGPSAPPPQNRVYAETDEEIELLYIARSHRFKNSAPPIRWQMFCTALNLPHETSGNPTIDLRATAGANRPLPIPHQRE